MEVKEERIEIMENIESYDVILTTYGTLKNDYEWYNDKEFDYCIIDEAQHIKNPQSISSETVKEIKAKSNLPYRYTNRKIIS